MLCCYGRSVTLLRSDEGYWAGHILVIRNRDHGNNDVTGRQWKRLPTAYSQAQRGVLQLGFGRSQRRGQLAQNLRVGVKGVAGSTPGLVRERRPFSGHRRKLPLNRWSQGTSGDAMTAAAEAAGPRSH